MLHNPFKKWAFAAGLLVAAGSTSLALAQGRPPDENAPVAANAPGKGPAGTLAPSTVGRMWMATARYVCEDNAVLKKNQRQLLGQLDSSSSASFGRSLKKAEAEAKDDKFKSNLAGFQKLFADINTKYPQAQPAALEGFINSALVKNKSSRETQGNFNQFRMVLNGLATPAAPAAAPTAGTGMEAGTGAGSVPATDLGDLHTTPAATTATPAGITDYVPWAALALAAISLLMSFFKGNGNGNKTGGYNSSADFNPSQRDELNKLVRKEVQQVLAARTDTRATATASSGPVASAPAAAPTADAVSAPLETMPAAPLPAAPAPVMHTLYANQQPVDGFFQRDSLAGAPAAYTIFELVVDERTPEQARFSVIRNPVGHAGYIGSHQTILNGACTYPFPQGNVSRIVTDAPGTAERTATGDWRIVQKARIHFA